jgi:hypothetical protein
MEEVRPHGQNAFYPDSHESRGNDKASPGADTARDQSGAQTDHNGNQKYLGRISGRSVSTFAPKYRPLADGHPKDGEKQKKKDKEPFPAPHYVRGNFEVPSGMGDRRGLQELKHLSSEVQNVLPPSMISVSGKEMNGSWNDIVYVYRQYMRRQHNSNH